MPETASSIYDATAPDLVGVWVFDPIDPPETERHFPYAEGREETASVGATELIVVGRVNPIVEYGEATLVGLTLTVFIPFGDDHDELVEWWRTALTNRRALCYRDNRKRLMWSAIKDELNVADGRVGTAIGLGLRRIDYDEAV